MIRKTDSFLAILSPQCHPHHQINQFLRFHYKSLLKYKRYSWPRHVARPDSDLPRQPSPCANCSRCPPSLWQSSPLWSRWKICREPLVTLEKALGSTEVREKLWKKVLSESLPSTSVWVTAVCSYLSLQLVLIFFPNCTVCLRNCEQLPSPSLLKMLI